MSKEIDPSKIIVFRNPMPYGGLEFRMEEDSQPTNKTILFQRDKKGRFQKQIKPTV